MKHLTEFVNRIEATLNWLKADYSLRMPDGSPLHYVYTIACQERESCLANGVAGSGKLTPEERRSIFGLARICDRLERAKTDGGISEGLRKHIGLLDKGIPSQASRYAEFSLEATKKSEIINASNVLFELTVALAALKIGTNVVLEPPNGRGKPDVCISVNGERWAFACKALNGANEQTWLETIQKGVEKTRQQLDKQDASKGCLFVSAQNVFTRNDIIYTSNDAVNATLKKRAEEFSRRVQARFVGTDEIDVLFQDARMEQGVVLYFEEVFSVGEAPGVILAPSEIGWQPIPGRILYSPVSYAQYITFGDYGRSASPVVDAMLKSLSGPNTAPI